MWSSEWGRWARQGLFAMPGLAIFLSGPASPADAQWVQGRPGKIWIKTAAYWQKTNEEFDPIGRRRIYIGDGESDARALYTDVIVGLHKHVDFWIQVPFFDLRYSEIVQDLRSVGFGDIRAWVRWQLLGLQGGQTPIALRVGAKAPIGGFPIDAQIVPIGEGQWDLEFFGEIGHSFWPVPAYAELWLGYRARFATADARDPGGEFVYLAESGVQPTRSTLLKLTVDGIWGREWVAFGYQTATRRRSTSFQFSGGVRIGSLWPEFGVRIPLAARASPAGPQFILALSTRVN